jgi:hypothetical protein
MTPTGDALAYDADLRFAPLDLRDLQGMGFAIPSTGSAAFSLGINTLSGGRTQYAVTTRAWRSWIRGWAATSRSSPRPASPPRSAALA